MARNIANPIGELSGSINGQTFARNRTGTIVRQKFSPCNPNSLKQAKNRNRFSQRNNAWHTLTDEQKNAWNTYGKQRNNTGLNEFISLNLNLSNLINNYFTGVENLFRINALSQGYGTIIKFYNVKNPPKQHITTDLNNNTLVISSLKMNQFPSGTRSYFLQVFFNFLGSSYTNTSFAQILRTKSGVNFSFIIYYREIKAQKSEFKTDSNFEVLFSQTCLRRAANVVITPNFLQRNMTRSILNSFITTKISLNKEYELQYRIQFEDGQQQILNNQYFTFT